MKVNFCKGLGLHIVFIFAFAALFVLPSCAKKCSDKGEQHAKTEAKKEQTKKKIEKLKAEINKTETKENGSSKLGVVVSNVKKRAESLDFEVQNQTGKTIYITCFSYIKKRMFGPWRWDKSKIYELKTNEAVFVAIDEIEDIQDRKNIFGYLGVFDNKTAAEDSTYELMDDQNKLDLDRLNDLNGKKVTINIERYGQKGEFLDFDFVDKQSLVKRKKIAGELDFAVENRTGKPILATCFVYLKKAKAKWLDIKDERDDMEVWRYDKTEIVKIDPGKTEMVDVDTIYEDRDRTNVRGILAVFDEDERDEAEKATYQLIGDSRKLIIGEPLIRLHGKKIAITVEKYGLNNDFIDFVVKPIRKIDFKEVYK
jgi:hypothetical protein